jgi:ComF family protein
MVDRWSVLGKSLVAYRTLVDLIEDTLFPVHCLRCGNEGSYLCGKCEATEPSLILQSCPFCGVPTPYGLTCTSDRHKYFLDGLTTSGEYRSWIWRDIVKAWKFSGARSLDRFLKTRLVSALPQLPHGIYAPLVVPVPLTNRRQKFRGFNQAVVLAESVASAVGGELSQIAVRVKETKPQSGLGRAERQINIKDVFSITNPLVLDGKDCLVVDDLVTTGATMNEMARVLKLAGAKKVWGVSLFRVLF